MGMHTNRIIGGAVMIPAGTSALPSVPVGDLSAGLSFAGAAGATEAIVTSANAVAVERVNATGVKIAVGVAAAPVATALLELESTTQGLLIPRMTGAERDAIGTPATGLVIYNTTTNKLNFRAAAAWEAVTSA